MHKIKKIIKYTTFWITLASFIAVGWLLIWIGFVISGDTSLLGWSNAVLFSAVIILGFGWILFASLSGFFDMLFYSTAAFATSLFSRKKRMRNYYEFTQREKKINKQFFTGVGIACALFFIAAITLYIVYIA